jgi:hypothetical protein
MGDARKFFFVHLMKTAGGTLLQQILANFAREEVYPAAGIDPDLRTANYSLDYLTGLPAERLRQVRVFTGHFPFVAVELLGMDLTTITIVRDPVERTLSYLRHCQRYHDQHRELSLEEIYDDPVFFPCFIENHQTKIFALTVEDRPESFMDVVEIDARRLARAKENLERVDVIGLQERFDELLQALIARVQNRNISRTREELPASFRRRIAEDNEADLELVEHARRLYERRRLHGAVA